MKFSILASGSTGNSTFIQSDKTNILIDIGLSVKKISEKLKSIGTDIDSLSAIFISHEHIDHVKGLGVISRKHQIPIYITKTTYDHLPKSICPVDEELCSFITPGQQITIDNITIDTFSLSHDAKSTIGFQITAEEQRLAILTDLGYVPLRIIEELKGADTFIIESNHDTSMLLAGMYPWHLKRRILSDEGHLSNQSSAEALSKLINGAGEQIYLAHLSQDNNNPDLALLTVTSILQEEGYTMNADYDLFVLSPEPNMPLTAVRKKQLALVT